MEEDLIFQNDKERELFAVARLGEDARNFLNSDVGRYLLGCAKQEIDDCSAKLLVTSPWRKRHIQSLQNRARSAKFFTSWINEMLINGEYAYHGLKTRDDDD